MAGKGLSFGGLQLDLLQGVRCQEYKLTYYAMSGSEDALENKGVWMNGGCFLERAVSKGLLKVTSEPRVE